MGRYNLLDEKWIPVILDESGKSQNVSIIELFENAGNYLTLGGDTQTQKFAILRFLLAIPQTVYSRFDADGEVYDYLEVDERFRQTEKADIDSNDEYSEELLDTWKSLWSRGKYSEKLFEYLEKWIDRFYLFDEKYPFFQVTEDVIGEDRINKKNPTTISGKTMNRIISESGNKIALFSPKNEKDKNKEILKEDEIARWLITFQGYVGTSDKVMFGSEKYTASKGWIYDIGGIYIEGDNLFETLMLNTILGDDNDLNLKVQKPCWEYSGREIVERALTLNNPNNLAELYTTWSRAINIDPDFDVTKPFAMNIVKIPDIDHRDKFLEPMTVWRFNKTGDNKDTFTPKKHPVNQSMWRSFGNIFITSENENSKSEDKIRIPGIISWYKKISEEIVKDKIIKINAITMKDDGNATSWMPVDEVYDRLNIHDIIVKDDEEQGWNKRVYDTVDITKYCISFIYKNFLSDINEIRNTKNSSFVSQNVEEMYFIIDQPFREWISSIDKNSDKEEKVFEWNEVLKDLILNQADRILKEAGPRDFKGIIKEGKTMNIATAYSTFKYFLNIKLKTKEVKNGREVEQE